MSSAEHQIFLLILFVSLVIGLIIILFVGALLYNARVRKEKEVEKLKAVIDTIDSERNRIAEDLHDEIGPVIGSVKLRLSTLETAGLTDSMQENLHSVRQEIDRVNEGLRQTVNELSSDRVKRLGLVNCVESFRRPLTQNRGIALHFEHDPIALSWKDGAETDLYRIISELVHNSMKHAVSCSEVRIILNVDDETLSLFYSDNGRTKEQPSRSGFGITNIRNRVKRLGGFLDECTDFSNGAWYYLRFDQRSLFQPHATPSDRKGPEPDHRR